jgi:NAD(P)-dependent dehydrogenase (short-subunit alcohol dehydrogenase family)
MGRATALELAKAGADVAIGSLIASERGIVPKEQNLFTPDESRLAEVRAEIEAHGVRALALPLNVCSNESVARSYDKIIETFGKVDILINAAGSSVRAPMVGHTDDLWERMIAVNLTGPFRTIRFCLPGMIERKWGRIVNFASTAANTGYVLHAAYCSAKSGLLGLTRCVALEGAPHGVTCNAINPGFVHTEQGTMGLQLEIDIFGLNLSTDEYRKKIAASLPQNRFLKPEEVGQLAAYLCRDESLGIEGSDITIAMGSLW